MDFSQWQPLGERVTGITNTTTAVNVDSQRVPAGQIWALTFAVLSNLSGETVAVIWAIVRGAQVIQFSKAGTLADGDGNAAYPLPMLFEGEILRAIVTGSAAKSTVILAYNGWRVGLPPVPPSVGG